MEVQVLSAAQTRYNTFLSPGGETGIHAVLRRLCPSGMEVQLLSWAPVMNTIIDNLPIYISGQVQDFEAAFSQGNRKQAAKIVRMLLELNIALTEAIPETIRMGVFEIATEDGRFRAACELSVLDP